MLDPHDAALGGRGVGPEVLELPVASPQVSKIRASPVICYEALFANYVIAAARKGSQLIMNVTNDSWFGSWGEPQLHLSLSRFRTIETRVPMLRGTNTGISALVLPDDAEARFQAERVMPVKLLMDPGSDASRNASQRLQAWLRERGERLVAERLRERGLAPEMATPFQVSEQPIEGGGSPGNFMLSLFLPYLLAISAIVGGVYAANDLVAGEKERGTLETLLVAPASRRDLVTGKFLAVAGVSLVSSFLSVVGLMLPFYIPLPAFQWLARGGLSRPLRCSSTSRVTPRTYSMTMHRLSASVEVSS